MSPSRQTIAKPSDLPAFWRFQAKSPSVKSFRPGTSRHRLVEGVVDSIGHKGYVAVGEDEIHAAVQAIELVDFAAGAVGDIAQPGVAQDHCRGGLQMLDGDLGRVFVGEHGGPGYRA